MIIIPRLIILADALIASVDGVLGNSGSAHPLSQGFAELSGPDLEAIRRGFPLAHELGCRYGPVHFLVGISEGHGPAAATLNPWSAALPSRGCRGHWRHSWRRLPPLAGSGRCQVARVIRAGPDGRTGPGQRIEGAIDGGPGDIGEAEVVVAGVGPQPGEGHGQIDVGAL